MLKLDRERQYLLLIILVSVVLRLAAAFYLGREVVELPGTFDQISYHNLALRVLDGHGFSFGEMWWPATPADQPTAHWSFLYTLYLVIVYGATGVNPLIARCLQAAVVGVLMPLLVYRLSLQIFSRASTIHNDPSEFSKAGMIGLLAAGITAVYIYFVYYAAALMTESFYFLSILWSLSLTIGLSKSTRSPIGRWLLLGLALGLTVLLRQVFLLFVPFLLLWLWFAARPQPLRLLLPLLVMGLMIVPITVRNALVFDQFVLLNTNSGFAFYWGNHPIYGTQFEPILSPEKGTYFELLPQDLLVLNEAALNSAVMDLAIDEIVSDPIRYIRLSISRIAPYFNFWPSSSSGMISNLSRVGSFGLFLPFMVIGLLRTLSYRFTSLAAWLASPLTLLYLFMAVYSGIHILTWTLIRYRLPLDSLLIIFAGLAFVKISEAVTAASGRTLFRSADA